MRLAAATWLAALLASGCVSPSRPAADPRVPPADDTAHTAHEEHERAEGAQPETAEIEEQAQEAEVNAPAEQPTATESSELAPGQREVWVEVPGFEASLLSLPATGARPQPLMVVTHGAGGTADAHCRAWRWHLPERGFVFCLAGKRMSKAHDGHYYPNHHDLEKELVAALGALEARYADEIDFEDATYAGYSQGATMGSLMIPAHAARFTRLILIEGGVFDWNVSHSRRYRQNGGERVLLVCGVKHCANAARRSLQWLEKAGLAAHFEYAPGAGHTYGGAVSDKIRASLRWLMDDDPRWFPRGR